MEEIVVFAYGEDCYDPETMEFRYFAAMETDFQFTFQANDLSENSQMGSLLRSTLQVLQTYPAEETPGSSPGIVEILFYTADSRRILRFNYAQGVAALNLDLSDEELVEHLSTQHP